MSTEEEDDVDDDDDARDCIARAHVRRASNGVHGRRDDACVPNMLRQQRLALEVARRAKLFSRCGCVLNRCI